MGEMENRVKGDKIHSVIVKTRLVFSSWREMRAGGKEARFLMKGRLQNGITYFVIPADSCSLLGFALDFQLQKMGGTGNTRIIVPNRLFTL